MSNMRSGQPSRDTNDRGRLLPPSDGMGLKQCSHPAERRSENIDHLAIFPYVK
jgi:hypothetical protein